MQRFDPLAIPLRGRHLIEASAGTGKTYSIALLYLRLIIEGGLDVDRILVVTFTKSATEELRQRIRGRLREALDVLETRGWDGKDVLFTELLESVTDRQDAAQRLADSLVRMDEAAIFTIHSFCQRMLQEHAFESEIPFATEFIESEQQLRREILRDFWRRRFYDASPSEAKWASETWGDPEGLAGALHELIAQLEIRCIPEISAADVENLKAACAGSLRKVSGSWRSCADEIREILHTDPCLSRNKSSGYSPDRVAMAIAGMDELASAASVPWSLPEGVELLASSFMAGELKGKKVAPCHQFFDLFEEFHRHNRELVDKGRIHVLLSAYGFLETKLEARKRSRSEMYFNDLLIRMDRALADRAGAGLARRIRERFAVALVDEFQDTDPLQYRIFHSLFGEGPKAGLFMIGDPKQSIYSFRGADVFAYIRARRQTADTAAFTMDTNYRSTAAMVKAVNRLFDRKASFVFDDAIPFNSVRSAGLADAEPLLIQGAAPEPLQAMVLKVEDWATPGRKTIARENAAAAVSRWTAREIFRLLELGRRGEAVIGARGLSGGDLAVLVRTHREAELVQQDLAKLRISSVYYSQDSVFSAEEAGELLLVLSAVLDVSDMSRVNSALATGLFGKNAADLEIAHTDPSRWDELVALFEGYHLRWRNQGVAAMLQRLIADQQVVQRLLPLPGGERKLTNYLHLAELLQEASHTQAGMEGLVRWFSLQHHEPEETNASQQLRLESDEKLVRIVTVHKAKGLEYPVVFLPFAWNCRITGKDDVFSFHLPRTLEHVMDLGTGDPVHYLAAERERLAEDLRLLYVAVTRARYCCYFAWGKVNSMEKSALAWLIHRKNDEPEPDPGSLTEERITGDLLSLNSAGKVAAFVQYPEAIPPQAGATEGSAGEPAARTFRGNIDTGWTVTSYSRLVSAAVHASETGEVEFAPYETAAENGDRTVFTFPRGAGAGTCLHNIFEQLDFAGHSPEELQDLVNEQLRTAGFDSGWSPLVCRWITAVLQTALDRDSGLRLKDLRQEDRLPEMGFYFAMGKLDLAAMNAVLAGAGLRRVEAKAGELHGLMRGYIDLVFRYRGRYYLADYKSNFLGSRVDDYRRPGLERVMRDHRYDLQYLIYTVALHRYLGTRMEGYDYAHHFGGVYYLFLRGMHPDHLSDNGIFQAMPSRQLVEELDACFGGTEEP